MEAGGKPGAKRHPAASAATLVGKPTRAESKVWPEAAEYDDDSSDPDGEQGGSRAKRRWENKCPRPNNLETRAPYAKAGLHNLPDQPSLALRCESVARDLNECTRHRFMREWINQIGQCCLHRQRLTDQHMGHKCPVN